MIEERGGAVHLLERMKVDASVDLVLVPPVLVGRDAARLALDNRVYAVTSTAIARALRLIHIRRIVARDRGKRVGERPAVDILPRGGCLHAQYNSAKG